MTQGDHQSRFLDEQRHGLFTDRVVRNQQRIFRYIVSLVPNRADAEELFQQTCLAVWEAWDRYDPALDFVPWACGIAHNQIRNFYRKKQNSQVLLEEDIVELLASRCSQLAVREDDYISLLRDCLEQLPEKSRTVVEDYYGGMPVHELASSRSSSPNVIYKLLDKVRSLLHECLQKRLAGEAV